MTVTCHTWTVSSGSLDEPVCSCEQRINVSHSRWALDAMGVGVGVGLHPSCCEATTESTTTLQHFSATKTQQRVHGCWNKIKRKSGKFLCLLSDEKRWELFWSGEPVWLWSEDNTQPSACLEKIKKNTASFLPAGRDRLCRCTYILFSSKWITRCSLSTCFVSKLRDFAGRTCQSEFESDFEIQ